MLLLCYYNEKYTTVKYCNAILGSNDTLFDFVLCDILQFISVHNKLCSLGMSRRSRDRCRRHQYRYTRDSIGYT